MEEEFEEEYFDVEYETKNGRVTLIIYGDEGIPDNIIIGFDKIERFIKSKKWDKLKNDGKK